MQTRLPRRPRFRNTPPPRPAVHGDPVAPPHDGATARARRGAGEGVRRPLVLAVSHVAALRAALRAALGPTYGFAEAAGGADGIARAFTLRPDLVVSDVGMPGVDGYAVLAALKGVAATRSIRVVLLDTEATAAARLVNPQGGADAYLPRREAPTALPALAAALLDRQRGLVDPDDESAVADAFVAQAQSAVALHMGEPGFGVGALAEALGLSTRQVHRKLRAATDETPSTFIRRVRLAWAAELLADRTRSVKEVAYDTGFRSTSGFRVAFRESYGVAPSAYLLPDL